ncbi:MAG: hypothetical protein DRG20_00950 [Deltaproteobacteria bacterium]|nr:MAG: hypothetical protein DRG20_00950 [Deltaproteobacteria bacterium]
MDNEKQIWIEMANVLDPFAGIQRSGSVPGPRHRVPRNVPAEEEKEPWYIGLAKETPKMAALWALSIPVRAGLSALFPAASPLLLGTATWGLLGGTWEALKAKEKEEAPKKFAKGALEWGLAEIGLSALGKTARYFINRGFKINKEAVDAIKAGNIKKGIEKLPPAYKPKFIENLQKEAKIHNVELPKDFAPPKPERVPEVAIDLGQEAAPEDVFANHIETRLKDMSRQEQEELMRLANDAIPKDLGPIEKFKVKYFSSPMWSPHLRASHDAIHKLFSESKEYTSQILEEARPYLSLNKAAKKKVNDKLMEAYFKDIDFTPEQLAEAGLKPEEIEGYMAYRKALDKAYFEIIPDIMRKAGRSEEEISDFLTKHYRKNYFPAFRFGRYITTVKNKAGEIIWSGATEDREQAKLVHGYFLKTVPDGKVTTIDIFTQTFRYPNAVRDLYMISHHLPDLEKFMAARGIKPEEFKEFKKVIDDVTIKKWSAGRFAPRYDIPGFSEDLERALLRYAEVVPRSFNRYFRINEVYDTLDNVPTAYRKAAREYIDKVLEGPKPEGLPTGITSVMYHWFLGFKPVYAFRNFTQRYTTTIGRAIKEAGSMKEGLKAAVDAQKQAISWFKGFWEPKVMWSGKIKEFLTDKVKNISDNYTNAVMTRLVRQDVIAPGLREEIMPEIKGKIMKKFLEKSNMFVLHSDASNRLNAALTAINIAKNKGMTVNEAVDFARNFVAKTQWLYVWYSRPEYLKGWGRPLFLFKYWIDNYLRGLYDLYKSSPRAFMTQTAIFLGLAGTEGLPFIKDIESALDETARVKNWVEWPQIKNRYRKNVPSVIREGLPALIGIPGSWSFGHADLWPSEFPPVKLASQIWDGIKSLADESIPLDKKLYYFSPILIKHVIAAATDQGMIPEDYYGKQRYTLQDIRRLPKYLRMDALKWYKQLPKKWPEHQRVMYALGFTCLQRKETMEFYRGLKQTQAMESERKKKLHIAIARALADRDFDDYRELLKYAAKNGIELDRKSIRKFYLEYLETKRYR